MLQRAVKASQILRARRLAIGGKRPRCVKGKSCSAACVSTWKMCLSEMPAMVQKHLSKVAKSILSRKVPLIQSVKGGGKGEGVRKQVEKIERGIVKAAQEGNKKAYFRLEDTLTRIYNKTGIKPNDPYIRKSILSGKRGGVWDLYRGQIELLSRLESSKLGNSVKIEKDGPNKIRISSSVLGNNLEVTLSPRSTSFTVNGSQIASGKLTRKEKVAIIQEVSRQYQEIISSLREGAVLAVSAAKGDDRHGMRENAYQKGGFSPPNSVGKMYGRVINGRVVPSDKSEFDKAPQHFSEFFLRDQ